MTQNGIRNASPEQLDIWCAELMGWTNVVPGDSIGIITGLTTGEPPDDFGREEIPSPATDPEAAWELMEWWLGLENSLALELFRDNDVATTESRGPDVNKAIFVWHAEPGDDRQTAMCRSICLWALEAGRLPVGGGE